MDGLISGGSFKVGFYGMSRDMFLKSAFQFGFLPSKPCLFPPKSSLKFVLRRVRPKFISLQVKFPADRSRFQFCTTARSKNCITGFFF